MKLKTMHNAIQLKWMNAFKRENNSENEKVHREREEC